mgnify:CR=1 FL=1
MGAGQITFESRGANLGASLISDRGYMGVGLQALESFYGVPAGEQARIDLDQRRYEFAGELQIGLAARAGQVVDQRRLSVAGGFREANIPGDYGLEHLILERRRFRR